jgi:hypothetical protein
MSIKHTPLVAAILVTMATATSAYAGSTNLVSNGDFEITSAGNGLLDYNTVVSGWTNSNATASWGETHQAYNFVYGAGTADTTGANGWDGNVKLWGTVTNSPTGGNVIGADANFSYTAAFFQTVSGLTAGTDYTLSFDWAQGQQSPFTGPTTSGWNVTFGSDTATTGTPPLASQSFAGWTHFTQIFTATSNSQLLSFLATGGPNGLPPFALLDGVSLTEVTSVPVPGALPLMASGLIGLVGLRRRKNAK